ncbi:MAG TPA: hypothetical protein VIN38_16285 [Thiobacillus sp.]
MSPPQLLLPIHVIAATLLIQLILMIILAIGLFLFVRGERLIDVAQPFRAVSMFSLALLLLGATLASFSFILLSNDFYKVWGALFPGVTFSTIEARTALSIVFVMDLALTAILMMVTGGSKHSPFSAVLFMIPALAIFLRESAGWFIAYALISASVFLVLLNMPARNPDSDSNPFYKKAFAFISLACLALLMFIGYITRPLSLDEIAGHDLPVSVLPPADKAIP